MWKMTGILYRDAGVVFNGIAVLRRVVPILFGDCHMCQAVGSFDAISISYENSISRLIVDILHSRTQAAPWKGAVVIASSIRAGKD